jgi:membrane-bound metal-dependent hydrolase YbcI (DUF457 family)
MTWKSHIAVTGALTYAVTMDPTFAAAAAAGAVLPDRVEFILPWLKHRGNSHALALWIGLVAVTAVANVIASKLGITPGGIQATYYAFAVAIGGVCHLLEDMCSVTGIPLLPTWVTPGQKPPTLKVPLYKTGSLSEFAVAGGALVICGGIVFLRS